MNIFFNAMEWKHNAQPAIINSSTTCHKRAMQSFKTKESVQKLLLKLKHVEENLVESVAEC